MYKIIFCSDLHGNERLYNKLLDIAVKNKIKAIIIGGDICPHGHMGLELGIKYQRDFIEKFLFDYFKKVKEKNIELFIMMGNDDFKVNFDLMEKAEKKGLIKLLHNRLNVINNKKIIGYGFVPPMPFLLKDWEKLDDKDSKQITPIDMDIRTAKKEEGTIEKDFWKLKRLSNPKETIYVVHSPPFNTKLDITVNEKHVGSKAIKEFINKEQPPLTLHGHIHESFEMGSWKDKIGKTICLNAGSDHLNSRLNYVVIDLDDLKDIKHFSEV
jgi:Icc-related predicted phosphoesterase